MTGFSARAVIGEGVHSTVGQVPDLCQMKKQGEARSQEKARRSMRGGMRRASNLLARFLLGPASMRTTHQVIPISSSTPGSPASEVRASAADETWTDQPEPLNDGAPAYGIAYLK